MENKKMEKPKEEKETPVPNIQTTKPKSIQIMENPKEDDKHEQPQNPQTTTNPEETKKSEQPKSTKHVVWDCDSSLYDSFELKSFERQLDSAISGRTLSMPHLSDHRKPPPPPPSHQKPPSKKTSNKITRSVQKFLRSVFRPKQNNNSIINNNNHNNNSKSSSWFRVEKGSREGVYYVYDTSGALTTIPEVPESSSVDGLSPDLKSLVRKTASDRFAPTSLGISCA